VGRERRVALNDIDVRHRNIQFVGNDLSKASADAGTEINLPGVNRNHAFFIDSEKRIDLVECDALWRG
jgi:hypothetical protein